MIKFRYKLIFLLAILFGSFFWLYTKAATVNEGININLTVPGSTGGGGGGDNAPSILNITSSTSYTTAVVNWEASDDRGIASVSFVYGTSLAYGNSGAITGSYQTNLSGLATGTAYYFKISVTDTGSHVVDYEGQLSTLSAPVVPSDTTPPVISNVQVFTGITTATVMWNTNENADSQLLYGLTSAYGSSYFDSVVMQNHSILLFNLTPGTLYHFQIISTDSSGNSGSTADTTFTTQIDTVPPPDVSNFVLTTTSNAIVLAWTNPTLVGTPDFSHVSVVRKVGSPSSNPTDGITVYTGTAENFTDTSVVPNVNYFYTIFSFDTSGNRSPGIFRNGSILPTPTPVEVCGNTIDDDSNGQIDCADVACSSLPACAPTPPPTSTPPTVEVCNNGIDDNVNGQTDCADSACFGFSGCGVPSLAVCNNGLDDDSDNKIDYPVDEGCESNTDNDEYNPPEPTVPSFLKINLSDLIFLSGNRLITLYPSNETVTGLAGANLTVGLSRDSLQNEPQTIVLRVGDTDRHQFVYNATNRMYYADMSFGAVGTAQAYIEIDYGSDQVDSVGFKINVLPWGQVVTTEGEGLAGVEATLYSANGEMFPMGLYGQLNPITTDSNGSTGWMVPNGSFRISVHKDGYYDRSLTITVTNNVINPRLDLIAQPPKLLLAIDPDAPLTENIQNVAGALVDQTKAISSAAIQKIQDAVTDPEVKKVNEQVVAPAAITVVVAGAVPLISWLDLLPFLRLLFLQPLMLLGWRKREKWGLVYNSLNKLPIDLAMVRLINVETGRVIQSKVTDARGRFIFTVSPGKYKIEVRKNNFIFPSQFLAGYVSDGQKADIYHGEIIEVVNPSSITATIPLDPVEAHKKPSRLVWERFGRRLQTAISLAGILVTLVSLYISPKWYIFGLLVLHIVFFFIFRRLAMPVKVRNWGIVYDDTSKSPLSRVVTRLFNSQFNKLVDTQVTDGSGKYYFMAGDAKYYVTYEHKEYHPQKTDIINLEGKDPEPITVDVRLKKS